MKKKVSLETINKKLDSIEEKVECNFNFRDGFLVFISTLVATTTLLSLILADFKIFSWEFAGLASVLIVATIILAILMYLVHTIFILRYSTFLKAVLSIGFCVLIAFIHAALIALLEPLFAIIYFMGILVVCLIIARYVEIHHV